MIQETNLNSKDTGGAVGTPVFADSTLTTTGSYETNPKGMLETTASTENRSAKWRRPQPHDIPEKAANQYCQY